MSEVAVPEPVQVGSSDALSQALAEAVAGTTILLDGGVIEVAAPLAVRAPVVLGAVAESRSLLRFVSPVARLVIEREATGGTIFGFDLASRGHRNAPLIEMSGVDEFSLQDLGLGGCEGTALEARGCGMLRLQGISVSETGLSGAIFEHCMDLVIELQMGGIGRRARSAGIALSGCSGAVTVAATDVSGNAVTVRPSATALSHADHPLKLTLRAGQCFRALAVLGDADNPVQEMEAEILAEEMEDWAVLLSNCSGIMLSLQSRLCAPLRLDGRVGARGCRIELVTDQPDHLLQAGGSAGNIISERAPRPWPSPLVKPLSVSGQRRFELHAVADVCSVCGWRGLFRRTHHAVRETFVCPACRANLRYRAQAQALLALVAERKAEALSVLAASGWLADKAVFEPGQSGPFRPFLRQAMVYKFSTFRPGCRSGNSWNGIECQDLTATSFADASFDLVVTSDIMEHVRRPDLAWSEIHRILKPGGAHVFSIPVTAPMPSKTVRRMDTRGATDLPLLPASYHGDGAGGLSLVYTDFGADLLEDLAKLAMRTVAVRYEADDPVCRDVMSFVSWRAS